MSGQDILFSLFNTLKNKINSFILNATYSSKKYRQKLDTSLNMPFKLTQNQLNYIISEKFSEERKNNNFISPYPKYQNSELSKNINEYSSLNDSSSISTSLSIIEDFNSKKNQSELNNDNKKYFYKKENKNNLNDSGINKNNFLIGNKTQRKIFDKNKDNEYQPDLDEIYERGNNSTENEKNKEKCINEKILDKNNNNENEKEISSFYNEYYDYKYKNKKKAKLNNLFKNKLYLKKSNNNIKFDIYNEKNMHENKFLNSFKNLTYTHPQRFSYHSANKKSRKSKKIPSDSSNYLISVENNINILSPLINKKDEKNVTKIESKNQISEISTNNNCHDSNLFNDTKIVQKPQNEKNKENYNFNNLLNNNNHNNNVNFEPNNNLNINFYNDIKSKENNINNNITMNENNKIDNRNNNYGNCFMDLEEDILIHSKHKQKLNNNNNIIIFTPNKNPFLVESRKHENYFYKNNNAINPFKTLKNDCNNCINNNMDENYFGDGFEVIKTSQNNKILKSNLFETKENKIIFNNNNNLQNPFLFNNNKKIALSNNYKFSFGKK